MPEISDGFVLLPGGVHVWGPSNLALGAVPAERLERHDYVLYQLEKPGWQQVQTGNVSVVGDLPAQALRFVAGTAEELNTMLRRELPGPAGSSGYKIRIFDKRDDFCRFATRCGASNALSLYDPRTSEMALHFSHAAGAEDFELTFAHEFVHAYMDKVFRVTEPLWFAEGMAEYFSRLKWGRQGYRPTGKNWRAMMMLGMPERLTLEQLVSARRQDIYGFDFPLYYAQAWVLVHFLIKKHPEVLQGLLKRQAVDLLQFSDEYDAYLKRLTGA